MRINIFSTVTIAASILLFASCSQLVGAWTTPLPHGEIIQRTASSKKIRSSLTRLQLHHQEEGEAISPAGGAATEGDIPLTDSANGMISYGSTSNRRQWLTRATTSIIGGTSSALLLGGGFRPPVADAAPSAKAVSTPNTCDVSVSVWKQPTTGRLVYLLGTAHISSASADLAGLIVDDVRPDAVFVELDAKRVGMKLPMPSAGAAPGESTATTKEAPRLALPSSSEPTAVVEGPSVQAPSSKEGMFSKPATALGSAVVGGAIKGMYSKLGKSGFSPGEEFIAAVREGQKIGATVILGDRDVDVTLKRLSEALRATDLRSLLNPNSELEQSLQQLMPNDKMPVPDSSDEDFKSGLTAYIEVMKAKENVKLIMGQLQKAAPAIYEALVAERDAYMANGLNALNMFPVIVAVMGIAHVDGVEQYLRREGWTPVKLNCQAAK